MSPSHPNYIETHFEYKELTKIHGEPTYETIKEIEKEIKANAKSVRSSLGGGNFGHLGLVLSPDQYALISPTPFVRPDHPGTLVIPSGSTAHMREAIRDAHNAAKSLFETVEAVEAALRQQLCSAIDRKYLQAIRNRQSNSINMSIYDIFHTHLYRKYGKVTPNRLAEEEMRVKAMSYDPMDPPEEVYTIIEDLLDYAEAARAPITQIQAINIAYNIFNRTGKFSDGIKAWIRRPDHEKTWINLKNHFTEHHDLLRETGELTLQETQFQSQANIIHQMVCSAIDDTLKKHTSPTVHESTRETDTPTETQPEQKMNNAQDLLPILLQQMQTMQTLMENMNQHQNSNRRAGRSRRKKKYCWTHGSGNHNGYECNNPHKDHKKDATYQNKMGGNTWNCGSSRNNNNTQDS